MVDKINALTIAVYFSLVSFANNAKTRVKELMSDERGLSGVVVAILLILVAVLAVVMIWGFLSGYLEEVWGRITGADTIGE